MDINFRLVKLDTIKQLTQVICTYFAKGFEIISRISCKNIPDYIKEAYNRDLKIFVTYASREHGVNFDERNLHGVTKIGNYALSKWYGLKTIALPESVKSIGDYACQMAKNLQSLNLGNGVERIGDGAFQGCSKIPSVIVPNTTTYIGAGAFKDCTSLSDVTIPSHIENISAELFSGCTSLKTNEGGFHFNVVKTIGEKAFKNCSSLKRAIFAKTTEVNNEAFFGCTSLIEAAFDSIQVLGEYAFAGCTSLVEDVYIGNMKEIPNGTFKDCSLSFSKVKSLIFSSTKIGDYSFNNGMGNKDAARLLPIQSTTTYIGQYAFANCDLDDVSFAGRESSSITIGRGAFANNPDMTGIYLHNLNFVPTIECPVSEIIPDSCKIFVHYDKYEEFINAPYWSDEPNRIHIVESTKPTEEE